MPPARRRHGRWGLLLGSVFEVRLPAKDGGGDAGGGGHGGGDGLGDGGGGGGGGGGEAGGGEWAMGTLFFVRIRYESR